jgi:Glu-tRNA(Gln) amidotransferase subunit E-like FAD-binding protein
MRPTEPAVGLRERIREQTERAVDSSAPACSAFLLSRRVVDKVVILRKVSIDGAAVANLTDAEIEEAEIAMRNGGLKMFQSKES